MQDPHSRTPPGAPLTAERRQDPRFPVRPTEYIEIGDSNGGIILDISATGMAVATAQALVGNQTLKFRFQLPRQLEPIEASGEIHWIGETRKRAGVRFVDLPDGALAQILRWIAAQNRVDADEIATAPTENGPNGTGGKTSTALPDSTAKSQEFLKATSVQAPPRNGHSAGHSQAQQPPASLEDSEGGEFDEEPMYETPEREERAERPPQPERRAQARRAPNDSAYVEVDDGNAGLIGDLSATGLSLRAAKTLESDKITVRFQVPGSRELVDTRAWIVWKSASQKKAGARFEDLPEEARKHIVDWIEGKSASSKESLPAAINQPKTVEAVTPPAAPNISFLAPDSVPIPAYISPITQRVIAAPAVAAETPAAHPVAAAPPAATQSEKGLPVIPVPAAAAPPSATGLTHPVAAKSPLPVPLESRPVISKAVVSKTVSPAPVAPVVPTKPPFAAAARPPASTSAPTKTPNATTPAFPTNAALPSPLTPLSLSPSNAVLPPYPDSTWYLAPKKRFGFWKVAALLAVTAGLAAAGNYLYRSRQATPPNAEMAQKQSSQTSSANEADIPEPENFAPEKGSGAGPETGKNAAEPAADPAVSRPTQAQAPVASPATTTTSPVKRDTPKIKSDDQFVDEPRQPKFVDEPRRPASQPSVQTSQPTSQPPANSATPVVRDNSNSNRTQTVSPTQTVPGTQPVPRPSTTSAAGNGNPSSGSGSNPTTAITPANSTAALSRGTSPTPAPGSSPANSSASQMSTAANPPAGNAAPPRGESSAATASPVSTPAGTASAANGTAAAPATAPAQNPVGTVSFFSRFRAIRSRGDILNGGAPNAGGMLQIGGLASSPVPAYPPDALRQQIQGLVELDVSVAADGTVQSVHLVRGPAELAAVAMSAVRGWRYSPTVLGGKAVEAQQSVFFTFKLGK